MRARIKNKTISNCTHKQVIRLNDIMQSDSMSNVDHAIQDFHDSLHSYYKVACKRFVDSLRMQTVDYYLITGPSTLLKLFSFVFVTEMTLVQLKDVLEENLTQKRKRVQLKKEHKNLKNDKKILNYFSFVFSQESNQFLQKSKIAIE